MNTPATCMVFDKETGNAIDSFDYTPEALRQRADELEGPRTFYFDRDGGVYPTWVWTGEQSGSAL